MKENITIEYLQQRDTALSKILNSLSEGAYIVTPDRKVIYWNRGAEAITGYTSEEICGLNCRDTKLHHFDMQGNLLCQSGECPAMIAFDKKEHINSKIFVVHKSGRKIPVMTHISPITDDAGNIIAIIEIFTDISKEEQLRQLQEQFNQRMQFQLETASKIQSLFRPKIEEIGHGSHAWAESIPATFVGGDLYDLIPMPDGGWLCYVADVSGKELPAALIMSALWTRMRSEAYAHHKLTDLLACVNRDMYQLVSEEGYFATLVLGKYWPPTGKMELSLAGHLNPLWIADHRVKAIPKISGVSLGACADSTYKSETIHMLPGESVLFITDGLTEALNERMELFNQQRIVDFVKESNGPPWGAGLVETIRAWRNTQEPNDDLTVLEIWRELN